MHLDRADSPAPPHRRSAGLPRLRLLREPQPRRRPAAEHGPAGASRAVLVSPAAGQPGPFPIHLVGGQGRALSRYYLATGPAPNTPASYEPSGLYRTDDDFQPWRRLRSFLVDWQHFRNVTIGGLAYNPSATDQVGVPGPGWSRPGGADQPGCRDDLAAAGAPGPGDDLALGIDDQNLYAATDRGCGGCGSRSRPSRSPVGAPSTSELDLEPLYSE